MMIELLDEGINLFRFRIPEEHGVVIISLESTFIIFKVTQAAISALYFLKLFRTFIVI